MLNKNYLLFIITLLISFFVIFKIFDFPYKKNIKIIISQNKSGISNILQKRLIGKTKSYYIDTLNFPKDSELKHKLFGRIGYNSNFFIDAYNKFELKDDENITFGVQSDDGFIFKIDDKILFSHEKDRPYTLSKESIVLKRGIHKIEINYFQGGGPLGFGVFYKSNDKTYILGEESNNVKFLEYENK